MRAAVNVAQATVEKPVEIPISSEISPTKVSIYISLHRKWDKRAIVEKRCSFRPILARVLRHNAQMTSIWIGTSGFSYKEWKPVFYPQDLPAKDFLHYYASRLNGVEIDSTFYRMPNQATIESWRSATPEAFRFSVKASQQITHRQRLKVPSEALEYFVNVVSGLGTRLGMVLFQLPPFFRCDVPKLETFLSVIPRGIPAAFEFRHESWFVADVYSLLKKRNVALCIHDADDHTTPLELTAAFTYVRLRRSEYSLEQRREWQNRVRGWAREGIDVYAFVKHEDNPDAPLIAMEFAKDLGMSVT